MNTFLAHPHVKRSRIVPVYFRTKAVGEADVKAIEDLCVFLSGKDKGKGPQKPLQSAAPVQIKEATRAPQSKFFCPNLIRWHGPGFLPRTL